MSLIVGIPLGVIIGVIITLVGHDKFANDDINVEMQTIASSVIALSACVALIINFLSIKGQKDSRRWEVNKGILLDLSKTLSDLINQTSKLVDNEFCNAQGIPEEHKFTPDRSIYKKFNQHLSHTKDVYGAVLNKQIIHAIDIYKNESALITSGVEQDALTLFEAYDAELAAQTELQKVLSQCIKRYANI